MIIWAQILSWALICSLAQGFIIYALLWLTLKLLPGASAGTKYKLSLGALAILLVWFALTLGQQVSRFTFMSGVTDGHSTTATKTLQLPASETIAALQPAWAHYLFPYLAAAYLTGLVLMLLRLSMGVQQLASIRKKDLETAPGHLYELLYSLKTKLQLRRPVRLFISGRAKVPMVIGFIKPVLLLPAASLLKLSPEQLETILLHELAHIKRHDFLLNMLQAIAETILFFNPFVWLISAIVRREREYCCDDLVLAHTPEPLSYARALTTLAEPDVYPVSFALAATGHPLMLRVSRIMELKKRPFSYSRIAAALLTAVLLIFAASRVSHSFAMIRKDMSGTPALSGNPTIQAETNSEEQLLVTQLSNDRLIDEGKGFIIEKKDGKLFIDYKALPDDMAKRYLSPIKKKELRIQVYPLQERIRRHPGSSLLQLAAPVQLSSPCVDYSTPKEGC